MTAICKVCGREADHMSGVIITSEGWCNICKDCADAVDEWKKERAKVVKE